MKNNEFNRERRQKREKRLDKKIGHGFVQIFNR